MKKTNTFLLALVAVLCCLVAVACDKDPSYPPQGTIDPIEAGDNMGFQGQSLSPTCLRTS